MTSEPEMQKAERAAGRAPAQLGQFISVLAGTWPEAPPLWMHREARKKLAGFLANEILHDVFVNIGNTIVATRRLLFVFFETLLGK